MTLLPSEARGATGRDISAPSGAAQQQTALGFTVKVSSDGKKPSLYLTTQNAGNDIRKARRRETGTIGASADGKKSTLTLAECEGTADAEAPRRAEQSAKAETLTMLLEAQRSR